MRSVPPKRRSDIAFCVCLAGRLSWRVTPTPRRNVCQMIRFFLVALALTGASLAHAAEPASAYPTKPIRLIVPFAPGGSNDIMGRLSAQKFTEAFGQQVVVDNRAGASGIVGTELAAKAPPDGYTVLMMSL